MHLLVIGAQKAGTTSLWEDLRRHRSIWLGEKETSVLERPDVVDAASFARAVGSRAVGSRAVGSRAVGSRAVGPRAGAPVVGEVCTRYAMAPHTDLAHRAREVLPDPVLIVYQVRDPVRRLVSAHRHLAVEGTLDRDADRAVAEAPELIDYSRYATQLRPWLEAFGLEQILVQRFEDYVADRDGVLERLQRRLGVPVVPLSTGEVHNRAGERRVATGGWRRVRDHPVYRGGVRRVLPEAARRGLMRRVLPAPDPAVRPLSEGTLRHLRAELRPEVEALAAMLGTPAWWDLDDETR